MEERHVKSDENTLYIPTSEYEEISLAELVQHIADHFGDDVDLSELSIDKQEYQFRCFGYDLYDSADWRWYFIVERR